MRISDWSSDVCSSDLLAPIGISANKVMRTLPRTRETKPKAAAHKFTRGMVLVFAGPMRGAAGLTAAAALRAGAGYVVLDGSERAPFSAIIAESDAKFGERLDDRSEEHTSELQSLMRISYAVFCLQKKTHTQYTTTNH